MIARSQLIAEDRTWFYLHAIVLRSSAITTAGSQTIVEVCFHMICDPRSAIVCDHIETSLYGSYVAPHKGD